MSDAVLTRTPTRRRRRIVDGILLFDKPLGLSSNKALQHVRWLYAAAKAGHTGSLDPLATGLLPLCFGQATKVCGYLLDADKSYEVVCQFGCRTVTGDREGEVVETGPADAARLAGLAQALDHFRGKIDQIPPMYSALKHEGERLYRLARQGKEVVRPARPVTIHELTLIEQAGATAILRIRCSKGTYVRTLVEDIAAALGTVAHVHDLRRLALGPFKLSQGAHDMAALQYVADAGDWERLDALLLPLDAALHHYPAVTLSEAVAFQMTQGKVVSVPDTLTNGQTVRLYGPDERFLGMGEMLGDGRCAPKRLMQGVPGQKPRNLLSNGFQG